MDVSEISAGFNDQGAWLRVPVRNVGAGVARVLSAAVTVADERPGGPVMQGGGPSVIAPGEHGRILFWGSPGSEHEPVLRRLLDSSDRLLVEVPYCDLAGRQEAAVVLTLASTEKKDDY
jgi:hypothetical protein